MPAFSFRLVPSDAQCGTQIRRAPEGQTKTDEARWQEERIGANANRTRPRIKNMPIHTRSNVDQELLTGSCAHNHLISWAYCGARAAVAHRKSKVDQEIMPMQDGSLPLSARGRRA